MMKIGTRSVLYGAHQFAIHPWFVALAWWKLYGFTFDPRLWVAFVVHDIGYLGKPNMDGPEGETHPRFGARLCSMLCDPPWRRTFRFSDGGPIGEWGLLVLLHSRYYAKKLGQRPSRLCIADKLAIALTPAWLYLPMVTATGEVHEYLKNAQRSESSHWKPTGYDKRVWYAELRRYMREWVAVHRNGDEDTWTSTDRHAKNDSGVWT